MKTLRGLQQSWKLSVVNKFLGLSEAITLTGCFAKSLAGAVCAIAFSGNYALGQVVGDNTLGTESSRVTSSRPGAFQINGGLQVGTNLFHSFSQFSVPTGGSAYFDNELNIQNIMTRVTGGSGSNIDGSLRANGTANLFLINPNGISFGPNAKLNINGSFIGSTASSLLFPDGTQFSAKDTQTTPLLTVNVPIGLQLGNNPAPVRVHRSNLEVKPNQNLVLVGGEVSLDRGKLTAPGGRIELGGLSTSGIVGLNDNGSLNFPNNVALSDVSLSNGTSVNVRAGGGGFITINARNLAVSGGSRLIAGIGNDLGIPEAHAGNVVINASDTVSLHGSRVENQVDKNARGNAGNIEITTGSLFLSNGASLNANTGGIGNAGQVIIRASDSISLDGSFISSRVQPNAVGNSGGIDITTANLSLVNNAGLSATTQGQGNGGQVNIRASDSISMTDKSFVNSRVAANPQGDSGSIYNSGNIYISANSLSLTNKSSLNVNVDKEAQGNAGSIYISANSLSLTNESSLNANTWGKGNAGQVIIRATDSISLDGSFISSRVEKNAEGNSGGIDITTGMLSLVNHSGLTATTQGKGDAGQVIIRASESIFMTDESFVSSRVASNGNGNSGGIVISAQSISLTNKASLSTNVDKDAQGNAGDIYITTDSLSLSNKASVSTNVNENGQGNAGSIYITTDSLSLSNKAILSTSLRGVGNAGQVIIHATDTISLDGAFISSKVEKNAVGNAGGIDITTGMLSLVNQAGLTATTDGTGNAGQVIIRASGSISMTDESFVNSRVASNGQGNAGGIYITTETLSLSNDASLNVGSFGQGNAGNINVVADSIRLDNGASINANTQGGQGNIKLTSVDLVLRHGSRISTNASGSNVIGGNITIDTGVLAALENSDISANSHDFRGGNVNITAQGIFGTKFRSQLTPESDITATGADSSLNGTVEINTPDVDPSQGLVNLPVEPVNVEVAQGCQGAQKQRAIEFFNTGRGGLASNPYEPISSSNIWEDVPLGTQEAENPASASSTSVSTISPSGQIVEAQGWLVNDKGEVVLVAEVPTTRFQSRCRLR